MPSRFKVIEVDQKHNTKITRWIDPLGKCIDKRTKIIAIYVRQSTDTQCTLNDQEHDCLIKANILKYHKIWLFSDKGSAWKQNAYEKLYGLQHLMRCIREKYIDSIIVYDISRLSRNLTMGIRILNGIKEFNLTLYSIMDEQHYTSNPISCNNFLKKVVESQEFSTNLSERLKNKFKHLKSKGAKLGRPPYGYRAVKIDGIRKFISNREENVIIKKIKQKIRTQGYNSIAKWLNDNGHTKRGYLWDTNKVRSVGLNTFSSSEMMDALS